MIANGWDSGFSGVVARIHLITRGIGTHAANRHLP
jgi:hypothetical protein